MRRAAIHDRKRELLFSNSTPINEVLLPAYNALTDPFLAGFFDNRSVKKHLRATGVLKKKRKSMSKYIEQFPFNEYNFPLSGRAQTQRKSRRGVKSMQKSTGFKQLRLPEVQVKDKSEQKSKERRRVYMSCKTAQELHHL